MESDLYEVMVACVEGRLAETPVKFAEGRAAATVVLAAGGYPGKYPKGMPISGLEDAARVPGVTVYHAGVCVVCARVYNFIIYYQTLGHDTLKNTRLKKGKCNESKVTIIINTVSSSEDFLDPQGIGAKSLLILLPLDSDDVTSFVCRFVIWFVSPSFSSPYQI